jgi:tRNA pseudouridine38-40 synthase
MTVRYRATLAYDGRAYQGFQRQAKGILTIQGTVEQAVAKVTGQVVTVNGAGRTDSGVHANGQVIAFDVVWKHGDDDLLKAINATLPDDIALQDIARQEGFHPRFDAVSRVYKYHIVQASQRQPLQRLRAWHVRQPLDGDTMALPAMLLLGEHDFATFGRPPVGENTVRTVMESNWSRRKAAYGWDWTYTIEANAFLQHMVRRIVGTLVDVGRGTMSAAAFEAAFHSGDSARAGRLAPPHGLVLETVKYSNG